MSASPTAPCTWPIEHCPCEEFDTVWPEQDQDIVDLASYLLWAATGKVFGPCPVSVLPCVDSTCGGCRNPLRDCGCVNVPEIRLNGPIAEITEVVIDGVTLPDTAYRVDDYEWLVRLDGGSWPTGDPVDPDSFRVDYLLGIPPPPGAGTATGALACGLAGARCGHDSCRLPSNVRSYTRQGVNVQFTEGAQFGLLAVDRWITAALAPILAGAVHSPDIAQPRQITWEASTSPTSP